MIRLNRLVFAAVLFCSFVPSPAQQEKVVHSCGAVRDIHIERKGDAEHVKFFFDENGQVVDLRQYRDSLRNAKFNKFGRYDMALARGIAGLADSAVIEVVISFDPDYETIALSESESPKCTPSQVKYADEEAFKEGVAAVEKALGKALSSYEKALDNQIRVTLPKGELEKLKHLLEISSIEAPAFAPPRPPIARNYINLSTAFNYGYDSNGVAVRSFWAEGDSGNGIKLGFIESDSLAPADSAALLTGVPLTIRNVTSFAPSPHPVFVMAVAKNEYTGYNQGGAPGVTGLFIAPGSDKEADYLWVVDTMVCQITSNSWVYATYWSLDTSTNDTTGQYWVSRMNRFYDIYAASRRYVTNVVAAGNGGDSSSTEPTNYNYICRNYDSDDRWTASTCQEIPWAGSHNSIIVGAVDDGTRDIAAFSSWRNDALLLDEAPHVMAPGFDVRFPDGTILSGTSLSAPIIASLVANVMSHDTQWKMYPEMMRVMLMASATPYPITGSSSFSDDASQVEMKGGAGIPKGDRINALLAHQYTGNQDTITISGCGPTNACAVRPSYFPSSAGAGAADTIIIKLVDVCTSTLTFYFTWVASPEGTLNVGDRQICDDIDIYLFNDSKTIDTFSVTSRNSTEALDLDWTYVSGTTYLKFVSTVFSRTTNKTIYCALAITSS